MCRKEGNNNPDLWVQVLGYLVNNASADPTQQDGKNGSRDGDGNPSAALSTLGDDDGGEASSEDGEGSVGEGRWDDVRELLALIERDQVLSPLRVREQGGGGGSVCALW